MYVRNIFIYNAEPSDRIYVDQRRVINVGGNTSMRIGDLRVTFAQDFKKAVSQGILERLDSLVIDMNNYRGTNQTVEYKLLGRGEPISITYGTPVQRSRRL